jgi:D-cysteine desulfhydrase
VLLRVPDPARPPPVEGNTLLDRLAGAEVRYVSHEQYGRRTEVMEGVAAELRAAGRRPYVIPEGGSNALGSLGYVAAMAELREQLPPAWREGELTIAYAVGSGGTGAGIELGLRLLGWRGARAVGFAVCNDARYFQVAISRVCAEARQRWPELPDVPPEEIAVDDAFIGPGYALATDEGLALVARVARKDGLILDPVYTGKAMLGVVHRAREPGGLPAARVVFLHTGGGFGLFPFAPRLAPSP